VGRDPADDGRIVRVAARVDLTFEQGADERVESKVDGVDRLEHDEGVAGHR
jgi:hypothetical protein